MTQVLQGETDYMCSQVSNGCFWDVLIKSEESAELGFIVHCGDDKSAGGEVIIINRAQTEIWLVDGVKMPCLSREEAALYAIGTLDAASAHWVTRDILMWRHVGQLQHEACSFSLCSSSNAGISVTTSALEGAESTHKLVVHEDPESDVVLQEVLTRFPHLRGIHCLRFTEPLGSDELHCLVQSQLCVAAVQGGEVQAVTGVQMPSLLDTEFYFDGKLGDINGTITIWAPTAQEMVLMRYETAECDDYEAYPMQRGPQGTWSLSRPSEWDKQFYTLRLKVFHYTTQKVEEITCTDPYSRGLSVDGRRSMFVDLDNDTSLMPSGWATHQPPELRDVMDISIYELHVRDFSASDCSVPVNVRGKYLAFDSAATGGTTKGQQHLQGLAAAGLTHVHLLPSYDFGSVPEKQEDQLEVTIDLRQFASDGTEQQAEITRIAAQDAFNWGYDPVHYGVPEGSYARDPNSAARLLEYRIMVQALHKAGLRVVQDVVYNHTFASGLDRYSVLDKIVPGYYHRRSETGQFRRDFGRDMCKLIESATFKKFWGSDRMREAMEHLMAEKLMIDDLVHWAIHYKIDGFRFDIMGHIMLDSMKKAQRALHSLTLDEHGVDGKKIYLYGEAWDFGEVACNQRGQNACQINIAGTNIGAFNDRFRDAAIGGSPFGDPTLQGFLTGLFLDPCPPKPPKSDEADLQCLQYYSLLLKLSMAGNLRDYKVSMPDGSQQSGCDIKFGHFPAAYCKSPQENVLYIGCHDNEVLYDQAVLKASHGGDAAVCARVVQLSLGIIAVSQGVPFFHAGDDLLRSKSLDRDSYNSGDWFNRVTWDTADHNFGVGLPPASKNAGMWSVKKEMLRRKGLVATPELISETSAFFRSLLRLRYSSPLFRLPDAASIISQYSWRQQDTQATMQVHFHPELEVDGTLVMSLTSSETYVKDLDLSSICVMMNASAEQVSLALPEQMQSPFIHPEFASLEHISGCTLNLGERSATITPRTMLVIAEAHN